MSRAISRRNQFHIGQIIQAVMPTGAAIAANTTNAAYTTVNIPKTGIDDCVVVTLQAPTSGIIWDGYVSAPGIVTIRASNITAGSVTPATGLIFQVQVLKR